MLVLTRRVGEEIVIGSNIRLTVVMVNGQRVRLGITAPSTVPVLRSELLDRPAEGAATPTAASNGTSQMDACGSAESAS